jgi:hypothetical protein
MTPNEIDILLHAIDQVEQRVVRLGEQFDNFRIYADQTYVRKDNIEAQKETKESYWKRHDRILARIAVLLSAAAVLVTILINLPK